jgi:hypothetical protein
MRNYIEQSELDQGAQTLRDLAILGLSQWLDIPCPQINEPSVEAQRGLLFSLSTPDDMTRLQLRKYERLTQRFLMTDVPPMSLTQKRWMVEYLPMRRIRDLPERLRAWFDARKKQRRDLGPAVAPILRDAIAHSAWATPEFRRDVLNILRAHARQRVIMHPEGPLPPALATPTLWAAATCGVVSLEVPVNRGAAALLQDRMRAITAKGLAQTGWAGFWDGYVLTRPSAIDVTKGLEIQINLSKDVAASDEYRLNWRDESPGYAAQLLGENV